MEGGGYLSSIAICSDKTSWINASIPAFLLQWLAAGHQCAWSHDAGELSGGDLCFYLSYGKIVGKTVRSWFDHNLVVHASDLPNGRGWSPTSWMILEGATRVPVTLLEAADKVDAGKIYAQEWFELEPDDLIDDWQQKLSSVTGNLVVDSYVDSYNVDSDLATLFWTYFHAALRNNSSACKGVI